MGVVYNLAASSSGEMAANTEGNAHVLALIIVGFYTITSLFGIIRHVFIQMLFCILN